MERSAQASSTRTDWVGNTTFIQDEGFMDEQPNMVRTMVIGGIIGALIGVGAAYILIKRAEEIGDHPRLSPGEGVQLGIGVLGLLRMISGGK